MRVNANVLVAGLVLVLTCGAFSYSYASARPERVIKVVARRFEFVPNQIVLKKGEPVVFEIVTEDVLMGFNAPDLKLRADILPQQVTRVHFTPGKTGIFAFLCDIFCGSGHENMSGVIKVID